MIFCKKNTENNDKFGYLEQKQSSTRMLKHKQQLEMGDVYCIYDLLP